MTPHACRSARKAIDLGEINSEASEYALKTLTFPYSWPCSALGGEKSLPEQRNTRITIFGLQLCIRRSTESKAALPLLGGVATMLCTVVIRKPLGVGTSSEYPITTMSSEPESVAIFWDYGAP